MAWAKGHHFSKQKACCFASVLISAILKQVRDDEALNKDLINKVLSQHFAGVLNCLFPALRAAFQAGHSSTMTSQAQRIQKKENYLQHEMFQRVNHPYSGDESLPSHVPQRRNTSACVFLGSLRARASFHWLTTEEVFNPGISKVTKVEFQSGGWP